MWNSMPQGIIYVNNLVQFKKGTENIHRYLSINTRVPALGYKLISHGCGLGRNLAMGCLFFSYLIWYSLHFPLKHLVLVGVIVF